MSWTAVVKVITGVLPWLRDILGSVLTGRDRKAEMEHEQTMEELKQGRIPVKVLSRYVGLGLAVLAVVWSLLGTFWREWWPDMPEALRVVLQMLPALLGGGG